MNTGTQVQDAAMATLEQAADAVVAPSAVESPDTALPADTIELEGVSLGYVDGVLTSAGLKNSMGKEYGRIQPATIGAAAVSLYGIPTGRRTGVPQGTYARFYMVPNGKGNNFVYAGHDIISRVSIRQGATAATLQTKVEALASIADREKAAAKKKPTALLEA